MPGIGYWANFIFWGSIMYGPNFSELAAVTVRRLAWAMGANMGQAVDVLVKAGASGFIVEMVQNALFFKGKPWFLGMFINSYGFFY